MAVQRLGDVAVGTVVKLNESGKPVNYIVVQQGSPSSAYYGFENVTTVLRQDIHSDRVWDDNSNSYGSSEIHQWLNNESNGYLSLLDDNILNMVQTVKIPYGYGPSQGSNGLSTKAFLLSMKEVNLNYGDVTLGVTLSYFVGANNSKRIAKLNGTPRNWASRTPYDYNDNNRGIAFISDSGQGNSYGISSTFGARPALPLSSDLYLLDDGTIIINQPPTAPGSIEVSGVVSGGTATITLTAATDPDGTVESYIYERQVDGGAWQQVAQVSSLTQTDQISEDWGTVAYRACAVDDMGVSGPYVTGETFTINSGWVTIGGPAEDMGSKPAPFDFDFSASVSGVASTGAITVYAALDGMQVYSGTPNAGTQISIPIDTRLLGAGEHTIEVQASKDDYLPASKRYTFTIPAVTIPAGGTGEQAQGSDGRPVFHTTLAQRCIGRGGVDMQAQVDALTARVKTLEG